MLTVQLSTTADGVEGKVAHSPPNDQGENNIHGPQYRHHNQPNLPIAVWEVTMATWR